MPSQDWWTANKLPCSSLRYMKFMLVVYGAEMVVSKAKATYAAEGSGLANELRRHKVMLPSGLICNLSLKCVLRSLMIWVVPLLWSGPSDLRRHLNNFSAQFQVVLQWWSNSSEIRRHLNACWAHLKVAWWEGYKIYLKLMCFLQMAFANCAISWTP